MLLRLSRAGEPTRPKGTTWYARELGSSHRTIRRAFDALEAAGLVLVAVKGDGMTRSTYLVNVEMAQVLAGELPEVTPVDNTVNPGESGSFTGVSLTPLPGSNCPPSRAKMTPPNARARSVPRDSQREGPHTSAGTSPPLVDTPPAASGRVPLRSPSPEDKCQHGRTVAQGGCRTCGTNARAADRVAKAEAEAAAQAQRQRQRERDELERLEAEQRRAETSPGAVAEALAALKAARA